MANAARALDLSQNSAEIDACEITQDSIEKVARQQSFNDAAVTLALVWY